MQRKRKIKPQPRKRYNFERMAVDEVMRVRIPDTDLKAGDQARSAAYAYSRAHPKFKFCTGQEVKGGKTYMLIRRLK